MAEQASFEPVFLQHLSLIDRIASSVARRQGLNVDEASDLTSWIHARLVENQYAAFRKFRGESSIATYLTVVIAMLARDYRVQRWGRWRPSAMARRHGTLAVRLETLVHRDGYPLAQAAELLRTSGETTLGDRELAEILVRLPAREPLRPVEVGAEMLQHVEAGRSAEALIDAESAELERRTALQALRDVMTALPPEDRLILRMRYWEDMGVADIARGLNLEQKPLYRRMERLLMLLRDRLTTLGITNERLQVLLSEPWQ